MMREKSPMPKSIHKTGLFALVAVISALLCALAFTGAAGFDTKAEGLVIEGSEISSRYVVGDTFVLPKGVTLKKDGKSYDASVVLRDPKGRGYAGESLTLTEAGRYVLDYRALDDRGKLLAASESFECCNTLYSVTGKSSAAYASVETYDPKNCLDPIDINARGVLLSLQSGDTFTLNKPIDLSSLTESNSAIEFFVLPESMCTPDAAQINVTLTDVADSANKVTVAVKKVSAKETGAVWAERSSYVSAGAAGQLSSGLESRADGTFKYEGGNYKLHKGDEYGTPVTFALPGGWIDPVTQKYTVRVGSDSMRIAFDDAENRVYANGALVVDLDDARIFGADVWRGFTGKQVLLSLSCSSYNVAAANIMITRLCDADITDDKFFDKTAPEITVDIEGSRLPDAKVGAAYPVSAATAIDNLDGAVEVYTHVWFNYGSPQATLENVENGKFTPRFAGEYTIEYAAYDKEGNKGSVCLSVTARENIDALTISLSGNTEGGKAGTEITVAQPRFDGGSGTVVCKVRAVLNSDSSVVYEIGENGKFVPLYAGKYTVEYTAYDYVFTASKSYETEVSPATEAYIDDGAVLPRYIIAGAKYRLPEKYGYTFSDGKPVKSLCTVGADKGTVTDGVLTVTDADSVVVTYSLGGTKKSFPAIPVIDVGYGKKGEFKPQDYFLHDGFTVTADQSDIAYVMQSAADESASLPFINALQAKQLLLRIGINAGENNFGALTVTLTDSADPAVTQKLTYRGNKMTLNDGKSYVLPSSPFGSSDGLEISYTESTNELRYAQSLGLYPQTDASGKAFAGFPSGKVYVTFVLEEIEPGKTAGLRIKAINNQMFGSTLVTSGEYMAPQILYAARKGERTVGDSVTLSEAFAASVLDPYVECSLSVLLGGNPIADTDGLTLRNVDPARTYTIEFGEFGNYRITYSVRDGSGKTVTSGHQYIIKVGDVLPPVITLGSAQTSGKRGDTIAVAAASVTDDNTAAESITVQTYLQAPSGKITNITGASTFTASTSGTYTVHYRAADESGNVSIVSYRVTVA